MSVAPSRDERALVTRRRLTVEGIVQGVGFRPFIHRLARRFSLAGSVYNFTGGVTIEVEGPRDSLDGFQHALEAEAPPMAVLEAVRSQALPAHYDSGFHILPSQEQPGAPVFVSPDAAMCADCTRELADPADRRYRHPFINCTNCGPRYTITARIPYDRPNTSMGPFPMCPACEAEYHDLDDRRYHAQPVACLDDGPTLRYVEGDQEVAGEEALQAAIATLREGGIVALKGLGGIHLACDAEQEAAVGLLRSRKHREEKPLAVMVASLEVAAEVAEIDHEASVLLQSVQAPIVLAPKRLREALAFAIAPDSSDYGLMLPYTPLHRLLFEGTGLRALVMTSGNLSDEPLCTDNEEARQRLGGIADGFLLHDRDILVGCDDSVVRTSRRGSIIMRRARGYVPFPVRLATEVPPVLAVGGHLKNTICLTSRNNAFPSQHIGDLENEATLAHFERIIEHLQAVLQIAPQALACDLHPDYLSTRYAEQISERLGLPLIRVQHHHAHIVSCMADNGLSEPVIGLACDGTGYGEDGTIWGCEVLESREDGFTRLGHLQPVPLPGGEAAVREPWRMAALYLSLACGDRAAEELDMPFTQRLDSERWAVLMRMMVQGINSPLASSAGRLFDAVSALLGLRQTVAYEGQAAMALEAMATPGEAAYPHAIQDSETGFVLDPLPMIRALVDDLQRGAELTAMAGRFHAGFAAMLAEAACRAAEMTGVRTVALSGGTFQNRLLLGILCGRLEKRGLRPIWHRRVPPNDGGLSLGQAIVAARRL